MAVVCFTKQLLRFNSIGKYTKPGIGTLSKHELRILTPSRARAAPVYQTSRCHRNFHTTNSAMVTKIMTADEMFNRKSLQDYLRSQVTEYNECMRAVNPARAQTDDEEGRAKRAKGTALAPLVQKIKELESKQKDFDETESLLKGRN